jgi:hypothetical protein
MSKFDKAVADAKKILGKEGKLPKFTEWTKDTATANKAIDEVRTTGDTFEAKLLASKKAYDAAKDTAEALIDDIKGSDFGLDPKDAEQKKQIKDAQDVLLDFFQTQVKQATIVGKVLDDARKAVAGMGKEYDDLNA